MSYQERRQLISNLENLRHSRVISYFLSDRESFPTVQGFSTVLSGEAHLTFIDQVRALGTPERLDLFLYTRGGDTNSVWPLVSLLREHCKNFTVVVPFRAHSGGTLICLGADEIIMTEASELSPIDPTTGNQFNPVDPTNPQNRYGISVEDVAAYFKLTEERAGIKQEPFKLEVLKELSRQVHPLALGNVQRVYLQIRELARKLLTLHIDETANQQRIEDIIKALTEQFYSHLHAITRTEAVKLLGDSVRSPTAEEETIILGLFNAYADTLQLRERFSLPIHMGNQTSQSLRVIGGFIETSEKSCIYKTEMNIMQRPALPQNVQVQLPPGTPLPLDPWVKRSYDFGVQNLGWSSNEEGL